MAPNAFGTKALATVLNPLVDLHRISICATAGDSALLPPAIRGRQIGIANDCVASAQLFGTGTDTIDAVATATGVPMGAGKRGDFVCVTTGQWLSNVGTKSS